MRSFALSLAAILAQTGAALAWGPSAVKDETSARILLASAYQAGSPARLAAFKQDIREARSEAADALAILRGVDRRLAERPQDRAAAELRRKLSFVMEKAAFALDKLKDSDMDLELARPALEEAVLALRLPRTPSKDSELTTALAAANASVSWALRLVQKWADPRYALR